MEVSSTDCPQHASSVGARALLPLLGLRWITVIVQALADVPLRFRDLQSRVPGIKHKVLTENLRRLQVRGLVVRVPVANSSFYLYALTDAGQDLLPIIEAVRHWESRHVPSRA